MASEWEEMRDQYRAKSVTVQDPRYAPFADQTQRASEWEEMRRNVLREKEKAAAKGVDLDTGGDFIDRMAVGIKITPAGKMGYLQSKYGEDNVRTTSDGELEYLPPDGKWTRFNERGFGAGDLADYSGEVVETIPMAVGGALTKTPLGAGAGAAAGNVLRQGLSELLPGDEGMDLTERGKLSAVSALLGAGSQFGANKLINLVDKARPHNLALPVLVDKSNSREAMIGKRLMDYTGVDLRKDQLTGNPTSQMLMGLLRRHPSTATMVKEQEVRQLGQLRSYFDNVLDEVSTGKIGKEQAANRATAAYEGYVKNLGDTMSRVGSQKFDEVWQLAERLPDKRIMKIDNAIAEWKKIIDDFDTPLGSDTATKVVEHARKQIELLEANGSSLNPKQFQRSMSIYSKASTGTGDIIRDVKDRSIQRGIASRVSKALLKDLDGTIEAGVASGAEAGSTAEIAGQIGEKLKAARDYWKSAATEIDDVTNSVLSNVVGDPGEKTVKKVLSGWSPSEVRSSMTLMHRVSPEAADGMKRAVLQEILDQSKPSGSGTVVGGASFSPVKLVTNSNKYDRQLRAMFAASNDMEGYVSWRRGVKVAQRIADHAGTDGSPTAPLQWTMSLVKSFAGHAWPFDYKGMAADIAGVLAPRSVQQAMLTNQGRQALFEVTKTGNNVRTVASATAYLKSLDAREDVENVDLKPRRMEGEDFISGASQ